MKVIKLPSSVCISAFNGPTEHITPALVEVIMAPVDLNKLAIYTCASTIEGLLETIITQHFFQGASTSSIQEQFQHWILQTNWCTYANKRTLVLDIAKDGGALKPEAVARLEKLLRKVMSYRNAFTHGTFATDGREVLLTYYEGGRKEQIVTDDWLSKVEAEMEECHHMLFFIVRTLPPGLTSPASGPPQKDWPRLP